MLNLKYLLSKPENTLISNPDHLFGPGFFMPMVSKNKMKLIKALRHNKYRKLHGLFIAEGHKVVYELLGSNFKAVEIIATTAWIEEHSKLLQGKDVNLSPASQAEIDSLSSLSTPPNVLALIALPDKTSENSLNTKGPMLMLDGINDPGNMGSIIRSADWFGIETIICSPNCVDPFNPKVVQATMGSVFRVKVIEADLPIYLANNALGKNIYGTFLSGKSIYNTVLDPAGIFIVGSESHGISGEVAAFVSERITIPSFGNKAESLNASVATAILLSEMRRGEH